MEPTFAARPTSTGSDGGHACPKCDKVFSRSVNRDRHLATHNKVPSLVCSICQRRFHRPDVLAKHVQRHRSSPEVQHDVPRGASEALHPSSSSRDSHSASISVGAGLPAQNRSLRTSPSHRSIAANGRVARACSRCSKAKARCDGHLPACGRCTRLNNASMCAYQAPAGDSVLPMQVADASGDASSQPSTSHLQHAESGRLEASTVPFIPTGARPNSQSSSLDNRYVAATPLFPSPSTHNTFDVQHHFRPSDASDLDAWRQSQVNPASASSWDASFSPLPVDWLLQSEIPDQGWTAYLGDPGVPLLADFLDHANPSSSSRTRAEPHLDPTQILHHGQDGSQIYATQAGSSNSPSNQPLAFSQLGSSRRTSRISSRTPLAHAASPATMDAAAAADTLARIRNEAVNNGFLRSATPSDQASCSSRSSSPDVGDAAEHEVSRSHHSSHLQRQRRKRARHSESAVDPDAAARLTSVHSPDSSSESSDLDPMERVNRDVAAQPRQQRISYRHPDPSARGQAGVVAAAQSPEDIARQEAVAEEMAQLEQQGRGRSPRAPSDHSSKRRKRRQKHWPSVYRPKATDGGRHLSLHKVPRASDEVTALENSFQVAPMTDLAKTRMIDEFRYCEVEPQDLQRIQDTLRSIETSTLNLFVQLYFEHHDPILPILHRATFDPDTCDPLLLAAVICLGALCSKAENAFAYCLLTSSLVHAVSYKLFGINHLRNRYLPSMQTLFLTYALWRNLGDPAKLEYVEGFRNIVLTMARRCRLFELDAFQLDPSLASASASRSGSTELLADKVEQEWHKWIRNQEMVRFSWALFVLDSDLSLAWDLPCTIKIGELRSPLPSPESLWQAESAEDWLSMTDRQTASASPGMLRHLLSFARPSLQAQTSPQSANASDTNMRRYHTSPLTHLVLSAAVYNVVISRWNLDTVLYQTVDDCDDEDGEQLDDHAMVPPRDPELQAWTDAMAARLQMLTSDPVDSHGKQDAQLMLHGARLRMLVSFKDVQIMSRRKGHRRSKLQMKKWLHGPLREEQYRNDVFREASKIFALSLAARRDIAPLHLDPPTRLASSSDARPRSNSRSSRNGASSLDGMSQGSDSRLSNVGHASVSGTGAENSVLFYATVCLALICQYLVRGQSSSSSSMQTDENASEHPTATGEAVAAVRPALDRAASTSRKTRRKDVYFLQGVGALTNPMSLDRLIHVAVHQGLNRSAWPLGRVLGKVLQQWVRSLVRS
ncbi:uncharacterized protein SRS1_15194 [Sporisorium reilianum f. sp. reilianum]|uniref:Zn(2)-C6 fungal-type domain-containing protein n=1 Tax=Sporisorium reilianum f. sp. reilianum TaxID=72559 RepID=A0A2N8UJU0_9BASI|nr:uncharacterized protein SRS1_15194 [Sporisorium reilianum f. sp. reilianum]